MTGTTTHVRHGLYLPADLLDQIRILANREGKSINKQIEEIIKDWLAHFFAKKNYTKKEILNLPLNRRREILQAQALQMQEYYKGNADLEGGEADFFDYGK